MLVTTKREVSNQALAWRPLTHPSEAHDGPEVLAQVGAHGVEVGIAMLGCAGVEEGGQKATELSANRKRGKVGSYPRAADTPRPARAACFAVTLRTTTKQKQKLELNLSASLIL